MSVLGDSRHDPGVPHAITDRLEKSGVPEVSNIQYHVPCYVLQVKLRGPIVCIYPTQVAYPNPLATVHLRRAIGSR